MAISARHAATTIPITAGVDMLGPPATLDVDLVVVKSSSSCNNELLLMNNNQHTNSGYSHLCTLISNNIFRGHL